mmetsp:Transcript_96970/g.313308  ORF Transcript_96970/g.313308 Transcript_96970/m.313308 type:complete len:108 (+) Transcript_96970:1531-1854(+)
MPAQPGTVRDLALTAKCLSSRDAHLDPTMRFVHFVSVMHNRNHWHLGLHATASIRDACTTCRRSYAVLKFDFTFASVHVQLCFRMGEQWLHSRLHGCEQRRCPSLVA